MGFAWGSDGFGWARMGFGWVRMGSDGVFGWVEDARKAGSDWGRERCVMVCAFSPLPFVL